MRPDLLELLRFGLTALATMFVVVDPVGVAPLFNALTRGYSPGERRDILRQALWTAFVVTLFFLMGGRFVLAYLGVTVHAFAISGGILLFATALPMLFGQRGGLQAPEEEEQGIRGDSPAIFPLAIPLLSGPGSITTILLLAADAAGDWLRVAILVVAVGLVYLIAWLILHTSDRLMARLGEGKVRILTRVLGIVLAALAVQYVLDGIAGYWESVLSP